ncbi:MAG: hypothetical protein LBR07_01335 [Puniceicoccales bacterium]|nr:hypothetical protein [Puniceicoccales bacterium]
MSVSETDTTPARQRKKTPTGSALQRLPPLFSGALALLAALAASGCFSTQDIGGPQGLEDKHDPTSLYEKKPRRFVIEEIYGDSPLRNFVVRGHFVTTGGGKKRNAAATGAGTTAGAAAAPSSVFIRVTYDELFVQWRNEKPPFADPLGVLFGAYRRHRVMKKLPEGFAPLAGDYALAAIAARHRQRAHGAIEYPAGFKWARLGRYFYQIPLDLLTSPIQLPLFIATFVVDAIDPNNPGNPRTVKPTSWTRADIAAAVKTHDDAMRAWRAANPDKPARNW